MASELSGNPCCWWNRTATLCCDSQRSLQLRFDDCLYQLAHKVSGIYPGGWFSRTIWNMIEIPYHKNWNKNTSFEFKDITVPTVKGSGKHDKFHIRVYKPRCQTCTDESCPLCKEKLPVILYFHGGGFTVLSAKFKGYHELCSQYASNGFIVVSVSYRLAPENPYPAAVVDSYKAMEWVYSEEASHATTRMDLTSGIVLMGDSAGGNLALTLATLLRDGLDVDLNEAGESVKDIKISKLVLAYPVLFATSKDEDEEAKLRQSFVDEVRKNSYYVLSYPIYEGYNGSYLGKDTSKREELERTDRRVSPMLAGLHDLPPTLLLTGSADFLAIPGRSLEEKLKDANTVVDHESYENQPHGFFSLTYLNSSKEVHKRCLEFLQ